MQLPKCDICGKDVCLKDGVISISFKKIQEYQEKKSEWEKIHRDKSILDTLDFENHPNKILWVWHHSKCNGEYSYWVDGLRFDTPEKALHWTVHLIDKNWFEFTNWRDVIHRFFPECDDEASNSGLLSR